MKARKAGKIRVEQGGSDFAYPVGAKVSDH